MSPRITLLAAALLLVSLAACGAPSPPPPTQAPAGPTTKKFPPGDEIPENIRVRNPKDARGIPPCQLLTRTQIIELGMLPDTVMEGPASHNVVDCGWQLAADRFNQGGVTVRTDSEHPALLGLYRIHALSPFYGFTPLEIAGHPGISSAGSANAGCTVDVAIADDQLLSTGGNAAGRKIPDPCGLARRIAEAVLSNLPPMR